MRLFPPTRPSAPRDEPPEWFKLMCEKYGEPDDIYHSERSAFILDVIWSGSTALILTVHRDWQSDGNRYKITVFHGRSSADPERRRVEFTHTHATNDQMLGLFNIVGVEI